MYVFVLHNLQSQSLEVFFINMNWYLNQKRLKSVKPSFAEKRIMVALRSSDFTYYREICFTGCNSPKGFPLVFDFYFPDRNLLIEYDGQDHQKPKVKIHDKIKNEYAKTHGIKLIRLNKANWKDLETVLFRTLEKSKSTKKNAPLKSARVSRPKNLIQDKRIMSRKQIREHLKRNK